METKYGTKKSLAKAVYIDEVNMDEFIIVDIREDYEVEDARIEGIAYIRDVDKIKLIADSNKDKRILLHCRGGTRAGNMGTKLVEMGCTNVCYFDDSFGKFYDKFKIIGKNVEGFRE